MSDKFNKKNEEDFTEDNLNEKDYDSSTDEDITFTEHDSEIEDNTEEDYYDHEEDDFDSIFVSNNEEEEIKYEKELERMIEEDKELEEIKQEIKKDREEDNNKGNNRIRTVLFLSVVGLLLVVLLVLVIKVFTSSEDNIPDDFESQSQFEEGEDLSVQKAKEIVEKANMDLDKLKENNNISTSVPQLPEEENSIEVETGPNKYSNSSLGVAFTYPNDWVQIMSFETKDTPDNVTNTVMVGVPPGSGRIDNMRISIEKTMVDITSKTYFEETEGLLETIFPKFQLVNKGEITVSGREAPTRTYLWVPQEELDKSPYEQEWVRVKQLQIYVAGKEKVYVVTFTANEEDFDENFDNYQEVLKTLDLKY